MLCFFFLGCFIPSEKREGEKVNFVAKGSKPLQLSFYPQSLRIRKKVRFTLFAIVFWGKKICRQKKDTTTTIFFPSGGSVKSIYLLFQSLFVSFLFDRLVKNVAIYFFHREILDCLRSFTAWPFCGWDFLGFWHMFLVKVSKDGGYLMGFKFLKICIKFLIF